MNKAELIELDANGGELELLAGGSWEQMREAREYVLQEREDKGEDYPNLMIQAV